jgi:hypothetical protein
VGPVIATLLPLPMIVFDPHSTTATFVLAMVTLLLHYCYTIVTLLSHCCYTIVTLFLRCP